MDLPSANADYSNPNYWNSRYSKEDQYDWLGVYDHFKEQLEASLRHHHCSDAILHLGSGNSSLSEDLIDAGWQNITNIDISPVVLTKMRAQEREGIKGSRLGQNFVAMDMTKMPFKEASFDVVIEKATLDSLLVTSSSPWKLDTPECQLVTRALHEVKRVLRPGGTFISITFAQPHFRVPLLATSELGWQIDLQTATGVGLSCFIMSMTDGDPTPALQKYLVGRNLHVEENEEWSSSDEERFLDNLCIASSEDEDQSEASSSCNLSSTYSGLSR